MTIKRFIKIECANEMKETKQKIYAFSIPQTFRDIDLMCQQHQLLRAPHAQLYMMPLHLVQRHHRVQSNCLADVKMLLTAPRFRFGRSNQNRNLIKWTHSHVFVGKCFDSIFDLLHFHRWFERICKQLSVEIHLYRIYGLNLVFLWPFWCFVFRFCFGKFVFLEFTFVDWFELWQTWMGLWMCLWSIGPNLVLNSFLLCREIEFCWFDRWRVALMRSNGILFWTEWSEVCGAQFYWSFDDCPKWALLFITSTATIQYSTVNALK